MSYTPQQCHVIRQSIRSAMTKLENAVESSSELINEVSVESELSVVGNALKSIADLAEDAQLELRSIEEKYT